MQWYDSCKNIPVSEISGWFEERLRNFQAFPSLHCFLCCCCTNAMVWFMQKHSSFRDIWLVWGEVKKFSSIPKLTLFSVLLLYTILKWMIATRKNISAMKHLSFYQCGSRFPMSFVAVTRNAVILWFFFSQKRVSTNNFQPFFSLVVRRRFFGRACDRPCMDHYQALDSAARSQYLVWLHINVVGSYDCRHYFKFKHVLCFCRPVYCHSISFPLSGHCNKARKDVTQWFFWCGCFL